MKMIVLSLEEVQGYIDFNGSEGEYIITEDGYMYYQNTASNPIHGVSWDFATLAAEYPERVEEFCS